MCLPIPCGYSMQTITKVAAYTLISCGILSTLLLSAFGIYLLAASEDLEKLSQTRGQRKKYRDLATFLEMNDGLKAFVILALIGLSILAVAFNIMLLRGAQERNLRKISIWIWYSMANALLLIPFFVTGLVYFRHQIEIWTFFLFTMFLHLFFTSIASGFFRELLSEESVTLSDWDWRAKDWLI